MSTLMLSIQRLPTKVSPTHQSALEDGFGEAVEMRDIPEPCNFPSLDSYVQSVNREANRLFADQFSFKYSNWQTERWQAERERKRADTCQLDTWKQMSQSSAQTSRLKTDHSNHRTAERASRQLRALSNSSD